MKSKRTSKLKHEIKIEPLQGTMENKMPLR
jgi:hypothetical protein